MPGFLKNTFSKLLSKTTPGELGSMDPSNDRIWSIAEAKDQSTGRVKIFRFASQLERGFDTSKFPWRIDIFWPYVTENGMCTPDQRDSFDLVEDLLENAIEPDSLATQVIVSTGENVRHWTYYTRDVEQFTDRLNLAIQNLPNVPLEIVAESDPDWIGYYEFLASLGIQRAH